MGGKLHGSLYQAGLLLSVFFGFFTYGALVGVVETLAEGAFGMTLVLGLATLVFSVPLLGATAWGILGATALDK